MDNNCLTTSIGMSSVDFANSFKKVSKLGCSYNIAYDYPTYTYEKDNRKYLLYKAEGLSCNHIEVEKEFVNKTQETYLNIKGDFKHQQTEWRNEINIHLRIDTEIYDKYDYYLRDGLLTVVLYEKENEQPKFEQVK